MIGGEDMGYRLPVFDIDVSAQKMTAYTKVAQNEMALQMYQLGVFEPANADRSLALLDIMDFEGKDLIEDKVRANGTMYQMLAMYQQMCIQLAMQAGRPDVAESLAQNVLGTQQMLGGIHGKGSAPTQFANGVNVSQTEGIKGKEHPFIEKARAQAQNSTQPGGGAGA